MSLLIDRSTLDFMLFDWLQTERLTQREHFSEHDRPTFESILDAAYAIATEQFANHAAKLDANEPTFDGKNVELIPEVQQALDAYCEGGFLAAGFPSELGGAGLPYTVSQAVASVFMAANISTAGYVFLTAAAANLLRVVGSEAQQARWLKPMLEGRYFGTMALSEPQAGSSLGDIRTTAVEQPDGSYRLKGTKMWISGAEHDLSENIVNMVLARIEGAPAGTRGISLFIVPRWRVDDNGCRTTRNDIQLAGLNHKMGQRGIVNTVLTLGENDDCIGYRVGEAGRGLAGMFHMMNEARIGVGLSAAAMACSGYLHSLAYARERPQGRAIKAARPDDKPVMIIEHTDVRRMLLKQKAYAEGGLALCLFAARLVDDAESSTDDGLRAEARTLLDMLTPIVKAWTAEFCLEANKLAIQVLGGYGYTRDYPLERLYRDNRLNPIHEGTNGIQALDLLGRKVTANNGAGLQALLARINKTLKAADERPATAEFAQTLGEAAERAAHTTQKLVRLAMAGDLERYLANANEYLEMLGHTVVAWLWLELAIAADAELQRGQAGEARTAFLQGKLTACRFFFRFELPKTEVQARLLDRYDDTCLLSDPAAL